MSESSKRKTPEQWEVVYDGPSMPMIASPGGRIFRIQQLHHGGRWDFAMEPGDSKSFVEAMNLYREHNQNEKKIREQLSESPLVATIREKFAAYEWLRGVALKDKGDRRAAIMLQEVARLMVGEEIDDAMIDRALSASIPGGSSARDWLLPHESDKAEANMRDVVRRMLIAARGERS